MVIFYEKRLIIFFFVIASLQKSKEGLGFFQTLAV